NVKTSIATTIPFTANVSIDIADRVHFDTPISDSDFTVKMIRDAVTAPDGKTLVFRALGYLWTKILPNGIPKRLTTGTDFEAEPAFTPDGKSIIYVTWNDAEMGSIRKIGIDGKNSVKLTTEKGIYRTPSLSPDGKTIVFQKEEGNLDQGISFTKKPGIYTLNNSGGASKFITAEGEYPLFTKEGNRIFYQTGGVFFGNLTKELKSVDLNGKDERIHIKSKYANRLVPSPDNQWIAFTHLHKAYVAPLNINGQEVDLDNKTTAVPVSELTKVSGINLHWAANSQKVMWTLGETYYSNDLKDRFTFLPGSPEKIEKPTDTGIKIELSAKVDKPKGRIVLTNARIITMNDDKVIENGTLVINQNRIEAIGNTGEVSVPADAKVYDLSGKTLMPGMVDAHAHLGAFRYGLTTQQNWQFYANLAYGVTTSHDPSSNTETIFTLSEMVKSGALVGPRIYSTGFILYGAEGDFKAVVNSIEDARSSIKRTKAFGALSVKSYNQPRRDQRQQILQAAREESINVVPEGGSNFFHNMTMVIDGHTGVEHNTPVTPVYKDVLELWSNSKVGYTPTLIVNYGGLNAELYWYQKTNVWENKKLLQFTPRAIIDSRSRYRMMAPDEDYQNDHILTSKTVKSLADSGVKINMGAHGQLQGLGAHWELWSINQGGMSNMETLKTATINSANYIGAGKDIGSLEVGKLADILVLEKNPLEDIQNSNTLLYTIVNGRMYNSTTMNEEGNEPKKRKNFYWENNKYNATFPWHEESETFMYQQCCGSNHIHN
ncbi:MAG: PD40 domain-containing protein, partial [Flavobacterium sp.]|nr:PD40 domain-containing protein [Flavobacterium sp.]